MYKLVDFVTKRKVKPKKFVFTGDSSPWEVSMDLDEVKKRIGESFLKTPPSVAKYLPFLPISDYSEFVSLSEGATPLIRSRNIGKKLGVELYFKYESHNPTGSFKDRGSAVELTIAKELNAKGIVVASTGNMAASVACYAAAAGKPCYVFVPENTPTSKLAQVMAYGGKIVQVKGSFNEAAILAKKVAHKLSYYLAGDYAYRVEGQKTGLFEILEQLFFRIPDYIVIPIGAGTNIAAYWKGLNEYRELGFINTIPRLVGAQAEGADSVVRAFNKKKRKVENLRSVNTIASAIAVKYPIDGVKALDAIYGSDGMAVAVDDKEILDFQYRLAREEGLFVESSSATSVAALNRFGKNRLKGKTIVCVLTGNGLKDPAPLFNAAIKPLTINPDVGEFLAIHRK